MDPKLEAFIDEQLRKLPPVSAPVSLIPGVLTALQGHAPLPWWQRAWWDWPLPARVSFALLAFSMACLFAGGGWAVTQELGALSQLAAEQLSVRPALLDRYHEMLGTGTTVWQQYGRPFLLHASIVAAFCYLACLGMGTAFVRVAFRRA